MIQFNEYFQSICSVNKLGFSIETNLRIPLSYLENKQFILFRTCHSYGDWVILSAMPRLIKQKYPECIIAIPSPMCISKFFSPQNWQNKNKDPFNNVIEIFKNNPYVDGMIDEIPINIPVFHDHFRVYDKSKPDTPLIQQMLKFWRFEDNEMIDCEPELYWSIDEIKQGDDIIKQHFNNMDFGFLYIDDSFLLTIPELSNDMIRRKNLIQNQINKYDLSWLYYSGNNIFDYKTNNIIFNVMDIHMTLRVQNYVKSKAKVIIGHQGGYGTDCMSRYTNCYVVPLTRHQINEHIQLKTTYID